MTTEQVIEQAIADFFNNSHIDYMPYWVSPLANFIASKLEEPQYSGDPEADVQRAIEQVKKRYGTLQAFFEAVK